MTVLHIELYRYITLSFTLTLLQGHTGVRYLYLKILCSLPIKLKLCRIAKDPSRSWMYHYFWLSLIFKGDNRRVSCFDKNFFVDFFMDSVQMNFFKRCIIVTLLRIYQFLPGLMTLTLFQDHRCVAIINCRLFYRFLSTVAQMLYGSYIH